MIDFVYSFDDGAYLEIKDPNDPNSHNEYFVEFIDQKTGKLNYNITLKSNHWAKTGRKYYTDWLIRVTQRGKIVFEKALDLKNSDVFVQFDSRAVGDNIGWMPYVEEFRRKHKLDKIYCSTFHNHFFEKIYPNIIFIEPNTPHKKFDIVYNFGYFGDGTDLDRNVNNPYSGPLQKSASDILGLDFQERHSPMYREKKSKRKIKQKYVCIAEHSTAQCKYWNNPTGWQDVIDYLNSKGYLVYSLSREPDGYMGNKPLTGVLKPDNDSMEEAIDLLEHCEFFIGLSSGLSWVAYSLKIKVIMISGFTEPWMEFLHGCIRLHNDDVCNGCWNQPDKFPAFDRGDWHWCPIYKNTFNHFICSKSIAASDVIEGIERIERGEELTPYVNFEDEKLTIEVKKSGKHYIRINSTSLGDSIFYMPYAEEYRKTHNVEVYVSSYWNKLFIKSYPNLVFIETKDNGKYSFDKKFKIDCYPLILTDEDMKNYDNFPAIDYRLLPLQLIAPNLLGLPMIPLDGKVDVPDKPRNIKGKYVVVAIQSTSQLKYWNNPVGWERVFDFLLNDGYKVVLIDRYRVFGVENNFNEAPKIKGIIDKTGNIDLSDRIIDIKYADMLITLSSGLAWVGWALKTPVIMISGFTKPWNEFSKNIKRIHNNDVCNGCWNDPNIDFETHWTFCPRDKDFECSKAIQPAEVIQAIREIEIENNSVSIPNSKGELVDKVTILQIKLENIKDEAKLKNIRREYNELKKLMINEVGITEEDDFYKDLLDINNALWEIEDAIREKELAKEFDDEFIQLARDVYYTNDDRSEVKKNINISKGSSLVEEKSYKKYD